MEQLIDSILEHHGYFIFDGNIIAMLAGNQFMSARVAPGLDVKSSYLRPMLSKLVKATIEERIGVDKKPEFHTIEPVASLDESDNLVLLRKLWLALDQHRSRRLCVDRDLKDSIYWFVSTLLEGKLVEFERET